MNQRIQILDEEDDEPILSAINLVDVFLVAIAVLMIVVSQDPIRQMLSAESRLFVCR
jgi:hypothetical protein